MLRQFIEYQRLRLTSVRLILPGQRAQVACLLSRARGGTSCFYQYRNEESLCITGRVRGEESKFG